jgi:hypothetical protein
MSRTKVLLGTSLLATLVTLAVFAAPASATVTYTSTYIDGPYDEVVRWIRTVDNGEERVQLFPWVAQEMKAAGACSSSTREDVIVVGQYVDRIMAKLLIAKAMNSRIRLRVASYNTTDCKVFYMFLWTL